ncbi:MAG: PLP-dependent aminotransferase family protein [Chloroflexota bacterium]|nr:PLP-dependent aminotransferase family protein [Chloroflexota bacterium]
MVEAESPVAPLDLRGLLSQRAADLAAKPRLGRVEDAASRISFTFGFPDPASLPAESVEAAAGRALRREGRWALQYGDTAGYRGLVDVLLAKLKRDQGIDAAPENVLITAGGSQAMALVLDAFVDRGDAILTEAPTWLGAVQAFRNVGARAVPVPVDAEGTDVVAVERELARLRAGGVQPKLIYVISNFQNPSGISTTVERRRRLIELARQHGTLILEDDAYFDLRYEGAHLPPIYALDGGGTTMYLGTFSKTMGAGMRLGWLIAAPEIVARLAALKIDGGTNVFGAHVAAEWIPAHLESHVAGLRRVYERRRDLMLAALERHMPSGTIWTRPEGGFFVWVTLPKGVDAERMLPQAKERGVEYLPGASCYADGRGGNQLRLSFSFVPDDQIEPGIRIIGEIAKGEVLEAGRP